ncbi:nucleolar protein 8-like [Argopecten irradians]|uniref:nucleolar protein 8-like n=1 Tax=Argopecten irradians TaxID=31199 RepID=UPI0037225893
MDSSTKRLFVGGLYDNIAESELRGRFSKFGDVDKIEIKTKKSSDGVAEKTFAYLDVNITDENLKKCFSVLNRSRWKGNELKIQLAKADFMKRLKEERENNFEKTPKPKKKKVVFQDPLDGVAGVDNFHMKGAVPGTPVGAEEKNWVVGKYGRVLPIVNIRRRDKRKMMKVDPSKFCHNSKRMKEETMEVSDTGVHDLTWSIDTKDSEMIKRRKGEFPSWNPKKKKRSSDVDIQSLADFYESFRTGSTSKNTDFEVVPDNYLKVSQTRTYFSEENDSSDEDVENHKTSTPFPSPFPQLHQKADVKIAGKDQSVKGKNGNVEKTKKLEDPKCTPNAKQLGKGQKDISKKILEITDHSKFSNALEKTATENTEPNSLSSISQNTAVAEFVSDKQSNSPKKYKTQSKDDQLCNQFNSQEKDSNDSINKLSSKKSDSSDFNKGNKSVTKKPKLQAFGGTRHLYDNPSSISHQKGDLLKDTAESTSNSLANKASSASQGILTSSASLVDPASLASSCHSAPAEHPSEAMCGVKRTLFQNSLLNHSQEKENAQEDSDGDSVSSADTDVIISSAKKRRGEGTVMGYGSMETPVSLQNSLNYSISEFGGGLVDGESSGQASWMDRWNYEFDDSDDSNDFEKVARKILKNQKETRNSTANNVLVNNDGEVKIELVSSSEPHNSKNSDDDDDDDDEKETTSESDDDDDDENNSSNKNIQQSNVKSKMEDSKKKGNDDESDDESSSDESDEDESGKKSDDEENSEESNDEDSGEESGDEESSEDSDDEEKSEESDDDNSSSSEEENKGVAEIKKSTKESEKVKKDLSVTSKAGKDENANKELQQSNENPVTQERKGKDKAEQERMSKEANRKKQEALRLKQEEYNTRKSIIKQALSGVDNAKWSNRIVFDSDSEDNATQKSVPQQPDKKAWDLEDSDDGNESEEESEDESEGDSSAEEDSAEEKDNKNKAGDITTANKKVTKSLFDESSSDGGDDDDEDAFMNKPQFEGEAGSELMKLQMKFNSDRRFKLDQRFAESDEEKDDNEGNVEEVEDEKTRNLKVLQEVVGVQVNVVTDKKDRMKKLFKDISALQYDPSREDHKNFEIQPNPDQKKKEGKKKKSKKQKADEEEAEAESLPVVSGEKFYEVDTSALEEAFKKPDETSKTNTGAFSLLAAFGKKSEVEDEDEGMQEETTVPTPKWQGFNFHNSSDDEDLGRESDEEKHTEGEEAKKEETPIFVAKNNDSFFFTEDDERIKEGIASFCRQEDLEKIRERWQEKRPDLIKAYHAKYKRAVRNKRALEKKKTLTKRK